MRKLIDGLRRFQHDVFWERRELFERSTQGQRPQALLITCSDSRILPDYVMQADPGDLFVARNAGNLVPPHEVASGEAATIEYAVSALGVKDIIVCGHYRCGAVKALLHPEEGAGLPSLGNWLAHASATREAVARDFIGLTGDELWDRAVERNVLVQLDSLSRHPVVAQGLSEGRLKLHAWVLRFESGEVVAYDDVSQTFAPVAGQSIALTIRPLESGEEASSTAAEPEAATVPESRGSVLWADLSASFVVFAVALPLCIAIAKASGVSTAAGIVTAIVGGIVVGLLGGGPLQVSGPTAGLILIVLGLGDRSPIIPLGVAGLTAGLLQLTGGFFRIGKWFRAISPAVVLGTLAGIGVSLVSQQLHVTVDDLPGREPLVNFFNLPRAVVGMFQEHGHDGHLPAAVIGVMTLVILWGWPKLPFPILRRMPGTLVAVAVATVTAAVLQLPIQRVDFDSIASGLTFLDFSSLPGWLAMPEVWSAGATIALVASSESLLTASATDQLHNGPRTNYDRELSAQGVANLVCGLMGALPMASVIVRSSANVNAGARSRWAAVFHGVWMLVFALVFPTLLRLIPTAALAAVLVPTGLKLIQHRQIRDLWRQSRNEGLICIATATTVVATSLLAGVLVGIGLSVLHLIYTFSRLKIRNLGSTSQGHAVLQLEGAATFIRLPKLEAALAAIPTGVTLHIDIKRLSYIDHACLELLMQWERQHRLTGGTLVLDWDILRTRFQNARPRPARVICRGTSGSTS